MHDATPVGCAGIDSNYGRRMSGGSTNDAKVGDMQDRSDSIPPRLLRSSRAEKIALVGVILVISLLLYQMVGVGFTCDDDMFTATARYRWGSIRRAAWMMATGQGRFYDLSTYVIAQVPFLNRGFVVPTFLRIASTASVFIAFYFAARSLLGSSSVAKLLTLIAGALLTTTHMFNPVHALPLWFNLGMTVLIVSIHVFHVGMIEDRPALRWMSGIVFFGSMLFYETFVAYALVFPIVVLTGSRDREASIRARAVYALRASAPHFVAASLYVVCWASFRHVYPSDYRGADLSLGEPIEMISTIVRFTQSGLNFDGLWRVPLTWNKYAALGAVFAGATAFTLLRITKDELTPRTLLLLGLIGLCFAVLPNIPFGFTPRYRAWVKRDVYYLGSFYAAFALCLASGAALLALQKLARHRIASIGVSILLALGLALGTYANHLESVAFFRGHRETRRLWDAVENALDHGLSARLASTSLIAAPSLERVSTLEPFAYDYWSFFFTSRLGHPVNVLRDPLDASQLPRAARATLPALGESPTIPVLVAGYDPVLRASFVALARVDAEAWRMDPSRMITNRATIWVDERETARRGRFVVVGEDGTRKSWPATAFLELESSDGFDVSSIRLTP